MGGVHILKISVNLFHAENMKENIKIQTKYVERESYVKRFRS